VLSILFSTEVQRHIFDESLTENFLKILDGHYHNAFEPNFQAVFFEGVPVIRISFVPVRPFTEEELQKLCRLLSLKFRQYCQNSGLSWRHFVEYHLMGDGIVLNLYYCEFKSDYQSFMRRYRVSIREKANRDFGVLRDENLDKELKNVK